MLKSLIQKRILTHKIKVLMQLSLPLYCSKENTFSSFYPGRNSVLLKAIKETINKPGSCLYLWSCKCAGRTHILQAACYELLRQGYPVIYLPLEEHEKLSPAILKGMENIKLVCLDDIHQTSTIAKWEKALLNLHCLIFENKNASILITADRPACQLQFKSKEFKSRLSLHQYRLLELSDEDKLEAIILRAKLRGFDLSKDIAIYLLNRLSRNMNTLLDALDILDKKSITVQRRITIPFIKSVLNI